MIRLSLQTLILGALLSVSAKSFAISEYLKQRGAEQVIQDFQVLLVATGGLLVLFLILITAVYLGKRRLTKSLKQHQDAIHNLPCGVVHLNQSGNIIYFNELAAVQLGRQAEKLFNQPFIANFDQNQAEDIQNTLNKKGRLVLARTRSSNLYLEIQTGETISDTATTYTAVTLNNQNTIKRQVDKISQQNQRLSHLIEGSQQGQVHIDITRDTFIYDDIFANLLGIEQLEPEEKKASTMSVSDFTKHIHNHDIERWTSALDEASNNASAKFRVRMQASESEESIRYIPVEIYIIATGKDSIDSKELDSGSERHTKYTKFSLLVRLDGDMETQTRKLALYKHQHEAILNASSHATYAIDQKGKLLWSNTRFHKLMKRLHPEADVTNLLELKPFPDDVMQLHKNVPFISTQTYEAEFELMSDDGRAISLKLDLAYYTDKDRLSEQQSIGIVGILQDISDITQTRSELRQERGRVANTSKELKLQQERVASIDKALMREQEQLALTHKDLQLEQERYAQASRELSQERERMKRLLALSPVAIATIDSNDQIVNANTVMLQRLKYSEKELRKGNIYKLFSDPSDAGTAARMLNKTGHLCELHVKLKGKDGNIYPGELKVDLFDEQKQEYLFWIVDRADEQFQRDKFEGVLQGSTLPMAIIGENGFTRLNQSACRFLGVEDEDDLIGLPLYTKELNGNEEAARELEQIITDVKRSGESKSFFWTHHIQQQPIPCHVALMPIYKDHDFDCIICIWNDQNELKKTDEARIVALNLQQDAERKIAESQKLLADKQAELAAHAQQNTHLEQTLNSLQENLSHTKTEYANLQQSHAQANGELIQLKNEYAQTKEVLINSQGDNEDLNSQLQATHAEIAALEQKQVKLVSTLTESEQQYKDAQHEIKTKADELEALTEHKQIQSQNMQALAEQISELNTLLEAKDEQLLKVNHQIEQLQTKLHNATDIQAELEQAEAKFRQELFDQQQSLELADSSIIEQAMEKQNVLNEEISTMQQSDANTRTNFHEQQAVHSEPNHKIIELEQTPDLNLDDQASIEHIRPDIEQLPMPSNPQLWFDLAAFSQSASHDEPLPERLSNLLDELEQSIVKTEALLEQDDLEGLEKLSKTLLTLAEKVHSHALIQLMQSIYNDCSNGMTDNVSIRWPATKQGIQSSLRVVYSHIQ